MARVAALLEVPDRLTKEDLLERKEFLRSAKNLKRVKPEGLESDVCDRVSQAQAALLTKQLVRTLEDARERGFVACDDGNVDPKNVCIGDTCSVIVDRGLPCPEESNPLVPEAIVFHTHPRTDKADPNGSRKNFSLDDLKYGLKENVNICMGYEDRGKAKVVCTDPVISSISPIEMGRKTIKWLFDTKNSLSLANIKEREKLDDDIDLIRWYVNRESYVCRRDLGKLPPYKLYDFPASMQRPRSDMWKRRK